MKKHINKFICLLICILLLASAACAGAPPVENESPPPTPSPTPLPTLSPEEQADVDNKFAGDSDDVCSVDYVDGQTDVQQMLSFAPDGSLISAKIKYSCGLDADAVALLDELGRGDTYASLKKAGNAVYAYYSDEAIENAVGNYNKDQTLWYFQNIADTNTTERVKPETEIISIDREVLVPFLNKYKATVTADTMYYSKGSGLFVDLTIENNGPNTLMFVIYYIDINDWGLGTPSVEGNFSYENNGTYITQVPPQRSAEFTCGIQFADVENFDLMRIDDIGVVGLMFVCVNADTGAQSTALERGDFVNPTAEAAGITGLSYLADTVVYEDDALRICDFGKDELWNRSVLQVKNKTHRDINCIVYESIAGNSVSENLYSRPREYPANLVLNANQSGIWVGPSVDVLCRKDEIEKPKATSVGVLVDYHDLVTLSCDVPGGTSEDLQPVKHEIKTELISTPDVRVSYLHADEDRPGEPRFYMLIENLNQDVPVYVQPQYSPYKSPMMAAKMDDETVAAVFLPHIVAPGSSAVVDLIAQSQAEDVDINWYEQVSANFVIWKLVKNKWKAVTTKKVEFGIF